MVAVNKQRVIQYLNTINTFGESEDGISRLAYSFEEKKAKDYIRTQCERMNFNVREDEAGNLIIRRQGLDPLLPVVSVGSHLDTVYNAGRYDGTIGVIAGLEILMILEEEQIQTLHPIELIIFACEESARFNVSTIGSKAMVGELDKEALEKLKDRKNKSIIEAFSEQDLAFDKIDQAIRGKSEVKAFLELHVEQGNRLIEEKKIIGIVTGIAAPLRLSIAIEGMSAHSGTTAMVNRKDAFLAASEISLAVERAAKKEIDYDTVATVGVVEVLPGAMNVVPGKANLKIDIRSTDVNSRQRVLETIKTEISLVSELRKVNVVIEWSTEEQPVFMDQKLTEDIQSVCKEKNIPYLVMPSGAGHDSMYMAKRWPTALVFVPSVEGLSHHPDEYTDIQDILTGIMVLKEIVLAYSIQRNKSKGEPIT